MNFTQVSSSLDRLTNDTNRVRFEQGRQNLGSSQIGKDAFLQLLLAQLQNQDPMNPVDDKEFISQQAAFTQIEKLDQLNATMNQSNQIAQASSLVGKMVEVKGTDGEAKSGRVESATITATGISLKVGDKFYTTDQVSRIFADG